MILVDPKSQTQIIAFDPNDFPTFYDTNLARFLCEFGIEIPPENQSDYENNQFVFPPRNPEDKIVTALFFKAFKEIYHPKELKSKEWRVFAST